MPERNKALNHHAQRWGLLRQLWDTVWLRSSRRKVAQNGNGVIRDGDEDEKKNKGQGEGNGKFSSRTELSDGYDFQTVLDLDHNQKIELTFYGYRDCGLKSLLYYLILIVSLGFMALVFHWNQHWALYVRRRRCALGQAQFMLIVEKYKHTEGSHHDALHSEAMQRTEEEEHEVYFVEQVFRVGVEDLKEQFMRERRRGVERLAQKEPYSSDEAVKEKWFERFLKRTCLFEKPEMEVKIKDQGDGDGAMSKSPDTATTLVMEDEVTDKSMAATATGHDAKRVEEIRIHEHFLKFLHFSVHFDKGVFEGGL